MGLVHLLRGPSVLWVVAAIAASLLLHSLPAWLPPWEESGDTDSSGQVLEVRLVSSGPGGDEQLGSPAGSEQQNQGRIERRPGCGPETTEQKALLQVRSEERAPKVDLVLAGLQKRISPLWRKIRPPEPGRVDVNIEISEQGKLTAVWVSSGFGSPRLARCIVDLIHRASPYPEAGTYVSGRMVVGCTFIIHDK